MVKAKTAQYKSEDRNRQQFVQDLKTWEPQLGNCITLAHRQRLDDDTIFKFMNILAAEYRRKCDEVSRKNERIKQENEKNRLKYNRESAEYQSKLTRYNRDMATYRIELATYPARVAEHNRTYDRELARYEEKVRKGEFAIPPVPFTPSRPTPPSVPEPPVLVQHRLLDYPTDSSKLPDHITDRWMKDILAIVKTRKNNAAATTDSNNRQYCVTHVHPLLNMAIKYARDFVAMSSGENRANDIKDWFLKQAGDNIVTKNYLNCLCTYNDEGFPDKVEKLDDIYWTALYLISAKSPNIFSECMKNFKPDKKGSSSTKKWIDRVCRALEKTTKYNEFDKYLEAELGFMAKAFSTKVPFTLSKRPTIKQKPVQGKIKYIGETIKKAAQNIKAKLGKEYF